MKDQERLDRIDELQEKAGRLTAGLDEDETAGLDEDEESPDP